MADDTGTLSPPMQAIPTPAARLRISGLATLGLIGILLIVILPV